MANIKSAKKRILVAEKKTARNRMVKSALKTTIKKFETAVAAFVEVEVFTHSLPTSLIPLAVYPLGQVWLLTTTVPVVVL